MLGIETFWYWISAGLLLILAEFAVPGFVICFFGAAALLVGVLLFFVPDFPFAWSLVLFAGLSVVLVFLSRKIAPAIFKGKAGTENFEIDSDDVIGAPATALKDFEPGEMGLVEFRGTNWTAVSDRSVKKGELVHVERRENLTLNVR